MSKKVTVVRDELDLKGGGLYCFLPFERIDKHGLNHFFHIKKIETNNIYY